MTYGRVLLGLAFALLCCGVSASPLAGTLLAAEASSWTVQKSDGRTVSVKIAAATWFVKAGLPVTAREFVPGEAVALWLTRSAKGGKRALLACDPVTASEMLRRRGHPLVGTILSISGQSWVIAPADGSGPALVCFSRSTIFSAASSLVPASAFGVGAAVTMTTRAGPSGLPSAVSVSDAAGLGTDAPVPRRRLLTGIVLEVEGEMGLLSVQDKSGETQTIATDTRTRIKVRKQPAALADITAGMHIAARLGAASDAAGNPVATSVSASP